LIAIERVVVQALHEVRVAEIENDKGILGISVLKRQQKGRALFVRLFAE
jgi:hypothetical protein